MYNERNLRQVKGVKAIYECVPWITGEHSNYLSEWER